MEALTELCDLVAQNPDLLADKLAWICGRCPPTALLRPLPTAGPPGGGGRVSRSHLHTLLALARFLSRCPSPPPPSARSPLLDFLRAAPSAAFRPSFWPQSFPLDSIASFFSDLLRYASLAADRSPELASDLSAFLGETVVSATLYAGDDPAIARAFLAAVSQSCPPILPADAERLVSCLLDQFGPPADEAATSSSENCSSWSSSAQSTPSKGKAKEEDREVADDGTSVVSSSSKENEGSGISRRSSVDQLGTPGGGGGGGGGGGSLVVRRDVAAFEEESVEALEKQEIAFRLFGQVLDRVGVIKSGQVEQVRMVAAKQLKSLPAFLKVRRLCL